MGGELLARTRTRWSNTSSTNWRSKSPTRSKFQSDRFGQQRSGRRTQRVNPQGFHSADSQSYYVVNIILLIGHSASVSWSEGPVVPRVIAKRVRLGYGAEESI